AARATLSRREREVVLQKPGTARKASVVSSPAAVRRATSWAWARSARVTPSGNGRPAGAVSRGSQYVSCTNRGLRRASCSASAPTSRRPPSSRASPGLAGRGWLAPARRATRPTSLTSTASAAMGSGRLQAPDEALVEVGLGVPDEPLLVGLEVVEQEHQQQAQEQRDERRVERGAQALGHAGEVALHGPVGLGERVADPAHRPDEPDGGDGPGNVAQQRQLRVETVDLALADVAVGGGGVGDVARGSESVEGGKQRAWDEALPLRLRERLDVPRVLAHVFGQDLHPLRQRDELSLQKRALAADEHPLLADHGQRPQHQDDLGLLLVVAQD